MILEFSGRGFGKKSPGFVCVCVCTWKCSSHAVLAHLSVIYSTGEMKPGRFLSACPALMVAMAKGRVREKMCSTASVCHS